MSHNCDLTHPDLVVAYNQAPPKCRTLYCVGGTGPKTELYINNPDIDTLKTALLTRMYYCKVDGKYVAPPQPEQQIVDYTLKDFGKMLTRHVGVATPVSRDEVVAMYKGRKATIYGNALLSLEEVPLNRGDATSIAFVKCEKVKKQSAPRCIQPRNPRYNLCLGQYIKPVEKRIYKGIAKIFGDGPTVIKGYNVQKVATILYGKWNSFADPVAIGLDATKFDMHVSASMLNWEHGIYKSIFRNNPEIKQLLEWQMNNVGKGYCDDGKLRYKVKGRRFSGDMNTALGNCILMCAMVWSYANERNVPVKLMNNGDDCMVFMERRHESKFRHGLSEWFLTLGFRMVVEPTANTVGEIEFCQMRAIMTCNGPIMVRNIPTAMGKDALSIVPLEDENTFRKWLGAVGECGAALSKGVPIMSAYYNMLSRNGVKAGKIRSSLQFQTGIHHLMNDLSLDSDEITEEARVGVFEAWGITPDHQVAIEDDLNKLSIAYGELEIGDHDEREFYDLGL